MKKNNLKQEIFLLISVALITSTNFFVFSEIVTNINEDGFVNFRPPSD